MITAIKSFRYAVNGLKTVWREEQNFKIEVFIGAIVVFYSFYFSFTFAETVFCIIAVVMVLVVEIINTIVEDICNKIQPNQDPLIEKIKDMSAAFVLITVLGSLAVGVLVLVNHFY